MNQTEIIGPKLQRNSSRSENSPVQYLRSPLAP